MTNKIVATLLAFALFVSPQARYRLRFVTPNSFGTQPWITCPVGAVDVTTSDDLQTKMLANGNGTTFCIKAGVHTISSGSTPRSGQTFIGEYGAILDGTGWTSSDPDEAAIKARNSDTDDITIRNLVIRNMPQGAIDAYRDHSDRWVIEYNEIANNKDGIALPDDSIARNNWIHHNEGDPNGASAIDWGGGYSGYQSNGILMEANDISYNGYEQKFLTAQNVVFRNNYVHHNRGDGIWYDGDLGGAVVIGNRVEDNGRMGIDYEASTGGLIYNNIVRRQLDTGIYITTSQNTEAYNNTIEDNFRGATYFINCGALPTYDLQNNTIRDNTIRVDATMGALAAGLFYSGDCSPAQIATYFDGSKNNVWVNNDYDVPNIGNSYWIWIDTLRDFTYWQAIPQDATGSIQ